MKLLYACLLVSAGALAQPPAQDGNAQLNGAVSGPGRGFSTKQKTGRADLGLARRLAATEVPLPTDQRTRQTLMATGSAPVSL
ncbi:MAG: hypothetical protein EOO39_15860, partial [Cytophagaceae bacterium]